MIGEPLSAGAVHDTLIDVGVAFDPATPVGVPGTVGNAASVLTGAEEADHALAQPTALRAVTWKTYDVPGVRPVTVTDVPAGFPVAYVYPAAHVAPPSEERCTA